MKIIYIHQYFKIPQEGGAIRSYYIAKAMVDAGYQVEMITAHNSRELVVKNIEGITVHYLPVNYHNRYGFLRRIISFLKFIYLAASYTSKMKADVCYATSTPLSVGAIAYWLKKRNKLPYYFEVRDLWPEAPIQLGILRNKLAKHLTYRFEKLIYHHAEKIICLSPGIENDIKKRFLYLETLRVPNMSDCQFFNPEGKSIPILKKFDVSEEDFIVSYFGAIGKVNHLEYLLSAAEYFLQSRAKVKFFIAGKGSELNRHKMVARQKNLTNTFFLGHLNKFQLRELLNITDAAYISFLNNKILESNSPNKFFDGLAAGKIIITNIKGWIKDLIDKNECGFYVNPEVPEDFYQKLQPYLIAADLRELSKLNARKLSQEMFSRDQLTKIIIDEIAPIYKNKNQLMGL